MTCWRFGRSSVGEGRRERDEVEGFFDFRFACLSKLDGLNVFNTDFVRLYMHKLTPTAIPWAYLCEGPDDCNGYGYLLVRLYYTGLGFQANIVEEYMLWSSLQHIFAGLKRTRDQKLSSGLKSGPLSLSSLFHRRGTCAVECVAAHLRGCWRSLIYCGVYLLPKVLHSLHSSCTSSLCSYLSGLRRLFLSTWYSASSRYWQYGRTVATRYGSTDATTATQLLINLTWFLLPWDIGTPSRSTGTLEPRDIGTPSAQRGERAPTREPGMGTDPRNGFLFSGTPLAVTSSLSAARFTAEPLMDVTTSWVGARWLQVQFLVSFFPETLRGGASPSLWVANFLNTVYWESSVSSTQSVRACGWWSVIRTRARATCSDAQSFHPFPIGSQPPLGG